MGTQPARRRERLPASPRKHVMASVRLDVAEHARVAAAAALAGLDRSAWMRRAILDALTGVFIIDRRGVKTADRAGDPAEKSPGSPD